MSLSASRSLSEITKRASLGLFSNAQSSLSSTLSATTSLAYGNVTTAFNNQLNGFLTDLNSKRASVNAELQQELARNPNFKGLRSRGVSLAWEYERADVTMGGRGTVEGGWNDIEAQQIRETGKAKVYDPYYNEVRTPEGHHINNVADHPDLQANPDNIRFYRSREGHVNEGHHGDVNNPSSGELIDKNAKLIETNRQRVIHNELRGIAISAGIGFGIGFALSAIAELAIKGVSSTNLGELIVNSTKTGVETAFISTLGYGAGRLATFGLTKIGVDVMHGAGAIMNFAAIGFAAVIVISLYQYSKLRANGVDKETAKSQVRKQSLFSISTLCVSMIAQGIYGGYAGIIVSTSIGLLYFGYNVSKMISQREKEEKLREETIDIYKEVVFN